MYVSYAFSEKPNERRENEFVFATLWHIDNKALRANYIKIGFKYGHIENIQLVISFQFFIFINSKNLFSVQWKMKRCWMSTGVVCVFMLFKKNRVYVI